MNKITCVCLGVRSVCKATFQIKSNFVFKIKVN